MSKKKFSGPTTYYCIIRVEEDQKPIGWWKKAGKAAYEYHLSEDKQEVLDRQSFSRAIPVSSEFAAESVAEWQAEMDFYSRFRNIERVDLDGYSSVSSVS